MLVFNKDDVLPVFQETCLYVMSYTNSEREIQESFLWQKWVKVWGNAGVILEMNLVHMANSIHLSEGKYICSKLKINYILF